MEMKIVFSFIQILLTHQNDDENTHDDDEIEKNREIHNIQNITDYMIVQSDETSLPRE